MNSVYERLMKYSAENADGCRVWTRSVTHDGYGRLRVGGKMIGAHRVMYEIFNGPIPPAMYVCHHCDNPRCVNPEHLFLGTNRDNIIDAMKKGRHIVPFVGYNKCQKGHELTIFNTYFLRSGKKKCMICEKQRSRDRYRIKKQILTVEWNSQGKLDGSGGVE